MTDPKQPTFNPNTACSFPVYVPARTMVAKVEASHPDDKKPICATCSDTGCVDCIPWLRTRDPLPNGRFMQHCWLCGDPTLTPVGAYCSERCQSTHHEFREAIKDLVCPVLYDDNRSSAGEGEL